jgi:hypothetical protein
MSKRSILSWLLAILTPVAAVVGVLYGVIALGRYASERLGNHDLVAIAAVECVPPEGLSREEFLAQVQYLAGLPDKLDPAAGPIPAQLVAAFSRHPWVEQVIRVSIRPKPRVELRYRTPVLAVEQNGERRAVDGQGVLLPETKSADALPILVGSHPRPGGPPGTKWGDPRIRDAAQTIVFLRERGDEFSVQSVESTAEGLVLTTASARIVWGHAPGAETADEAPADFKRKRLMQGKTLTGRVDLRTRE